MEKGYKNICAYFRASLKQVKGAYFGVCEKEHAQNVIICIISSPEV